MMIAGLAPHDLAARVAEAGLWLGVGAQIGALHFSTLRWNAAALIADRPIPLVFGVQIVRLAATGALLAIIARSSGAPALLAASFGILIARRAVLRRGG